MGSLLRRFVDIRRGEFVRTALVFMYLLFVLFAYYILKPVSRAMFLNKFDIDKLPILYILIAAAGGLMAYAYTKVALRLSLKAAVNAATIFFTGCLVLIWWLLGFGWDWMLYVFNMFVSLLSITLVSQGWLIAANTFTSQEAKRVYGLLGVGSVIGAAFGGTFTAWAVHLIGSRNLLLASAAFVICAYLMFVALIMQKGMDTLSKVRAAEEDEEFEFKDILGAIKGYRHLQVIISIIALTYMVDVMVEYQFNASAEAQFQGNDLTAFLGNFYGIWLNLVTFFLQVFLTLVVVKHFGVGGALQIMPVSIGIASLGVFFAPSGVYATGAARLTEAATRYSFNKTGMELLYLPLPPDLKNKTKAFVDIFVDRFFRGVGGLILILLVSVLEMRVRSIALVVLGFTIVWIVLSIRAKNEYITTVRKRLESRRLDLESLRVNVTDAGTIGLLEEAAESPIPRQAAYAISLLSEAPRYPIERLLTKLVDNKSPEVRAKVYEIARQRRLEGLYENALAEVRSSRFGDETAVVCPAVEYALAVAPEPAELATRLVNHQNASVAQAALEALVEYPDAARRIVTTEWVEERSHSGDPGQRALAAVAVRVAPDDQTGILQRLLLDPNPMVAAAACRTAAAQQNRMYLDGLLRRLGNPRLRGVAIESLAAYGDRIAGTLGDVLLDETMPTSVRRQIPRVLARIPSQRSVDVLMASLNLNDFVVRDMILKALNRLREHHPGLQYGRDPVMRHILSEARYYYEMYAALAAFRNSKESRAAHLLSATIEDRLNGTVRRLFRLLGLRYPPKEIYAAYLAVNKRKSDEFTAALDFLDNVLERELKKVLLPLFDDEAHIMRSGRELFGVEAKNLQGAVRELMRTGDCWLAACAVAAAAELGLKELRADIAPLAERGDSEVAQVAQSALVALA